MNNIIGCLCAIFVAMLVLAFSWLITCALFYLVCICFGWTFTWLLGTGVWALIMLLKAIF